VADEDPGPRSKTVDPNLEDAYIHFMQAAGQQMDLEQDLVEGM
jgi:hypothetical protein